MKIPENIKILQNSMIVQILINHMAEITPTKLFTLLKTNFLINHSARSQLTVFIYFIS